MRNLLTIMLVPVLLLASCGDDADTEAGSTTTTSSAVTGSEPAPDPDPDTATGIVRVRLEEVDGVFTEGFEIGLRFETGTGELIDATLWSEFVTSNGNPTIDDFYGSVLEQEVPAGPIVVLATVNIGIGPGPEIPDVTGELDCRLEVDVPGAGSVDVEVSFDGTTNCLRPA